MPDPELTLISVNKRGITMIKLAISGVKGGVGKTASMTSLEKNYKNSFPKSLLSPSIIKKLPPKGGTK